jgi:signal transduction histidine kinase
MRRFTRPSLFWTFAAAFLTVLVCGTLLQALLVVAVLKPMAAHTESERARFLVREAAARVGSIPSDENEEIFNALASLGRETGSIYLAYRAIDGDVIIDRPVEAPIRDRIEALFEKNESAALPPIPDAALSRRPRHEPPPERRQDGSFPPPDIPKPPADGRRGPARGLDLLARQDVGGEANPRGEVAAFGNLRSSGGASNGLGSILLFMPLAVLVAGIAGLIVVRAQARRLGELESLAARIASGDLMARIEGPGTDEIGRLGARLNEMAAALAAARDRIIASDRHRRRLFADVSHELATPLTSMRGFTETLLDPRVPVSEEERHTYLSFVLDESKRLEALVRDLFELTRLESGAIPLSLETIDWRALTYHTLARYEPRFTAAGLRLEWRDPAGPALVSADGRRLEQILENLLVNAIRYVSPGGTVVVTLDRLAPPPCGESGARASRERFRLTVADDGPGVRTEDLPRVFDRFYRAPNARTEGGTGLGLAIVKEIVGRSGGEVSAEAREPHGLAIVVELPAVADPA